MMALIMLAMITRMMLTTVTITPRLELESTPMTTMRPRLDIRTETTVMVTLMVGAVADTGTRTVT